LYVGMATDTDTGPDISFPDSRLGAQATRVVGRLFASGPRTFLLACLNHFRGTSTAGRA